uniref:Testis expressed 36 n=1 Tax=Pelusios castaneus TaxID=367368 RepID=A0A8C8R4K0_9SAUR
MARPGTPGPPRCMIMGCPPVNMLGRGKERFPHLGIFQSQSESITDSMLKQGQNPEEVQYIEKRLPLVFKIREQKAVKNDFPFSAHDNRHCLENVGEYFDFGLGRKKVEPERRQQNSQNFCLWAHEYIPRSHGGFTIYKTSFMGDQDTERPFCRRYPKQHLERCYIYKSILENEKHI